MRTLMFSRTGSVGGQEQKPFTNPCRVKDGELTMDGFARVLCKLIGRQWS